MICLLSILIFLFACGFDSQGQKVYDNADLLSEEEELSLQQMCVSASQNSQADIIVVTVDSLEGKTAQAYADDFFDYNGFGYEEEQGSGTLFLISMEERQCAFSTSGDCVDLFSQSESNQIVETVTSYLSDSAYYEGLEYYIETTQEYITSASDNEGLDAQASSDVIAEDDTGYLSDEDYYGVSDNVTTYNYSFFDYYFDTVSSKDILIELVAALVIALVTIWIMYSGSRSKMSVNGFTYANGHRSEIVQQHDAFQRTTTITRHIEKDNGGSGGSHVGSSGNRHGGSSGGF